MLLSLGITDFVLVDRLDISLEPGFTALTGETGAGKSILLDALNLALGERADAGVVREGADRAEISAVFDVASLPAVTAWLEENGLEGDEGTCVLRRIIDAGGRSRAFINGRAATLAQLKAVGEYLVDIHGQHAHYSLLRPGVQRRMLDEYCGVTDLADRVAGAWRVWQQAERRRREAASQAREADAERERLRWTVDDLTALAFQADEWDALQEEHRRLAHAAELIQGAQAVATALDEDELGIHARLQALRGRLAELAGIDPTLAGPLDMLESGLVQVQEAARELTRYAERLDLDPDALARAETRLAQVNDAARKYRLPPAELPGLLAQSQARLAELDQLADPQALEAAATQAEAVYRKEAERLSQARRKGGRKLGEAVSAAMQTLAMQGGRLDVEITPCEPDAGGLESVEFLVSPHAGQSVKSLAKTASGGELSRVGLALQTVLSHLSGAPTLVFDEVDAGIGGGVAESVGRLLAGLGAGRQVLCVTHLPQVAARAAHHWQVSKSVQAGRTTSRLSVLDAGQRVEEIARMLGGVTLTETTRRHAAEMLENR